MESSFIDYRDKTRAESDSDTEIIDDSIDESFILTTKTPLKKNHTVIPDSEESLVDDESDEVEDKVSKTQAQKPVKQQSIQESVVYSSDDDSDTDNSIIIEKNKNNKMKCMKDTPLKIENGKVGKGNDSEESDASDDSGTEGSDEDDEDDESDETDDAADEDQMAMSRATRMSIMGIIPKQNESDESDFIESDDSLKRSIAGSTESLTELPAVDLTCQVPAKLTTPAQKPPQTTTEQQPLKTPEKPETENLNDSVLTCSPIASPLHNITNELNNSKPNSPVLAQFTPRSIEQKSLKDKVLSKLIADDAANKENARVDDDDVTVIDSTPKAKADSSTSQRSKDNTIRQYLPPPSYPNQVRRQGDRVGNMVVEPSQPAPADVARDGFGQGLSWDDLQKASNAVQPRMFGKQVVKGGTLVVCPASLIGRGEVKKHCLPHRISTCLHHGAARAAQPQRLAHCDMVMTTYNILQRDSEKGHIVRNHKSATSRAVCGLRARRRWALTGTPVHNKDLDLFALLKYLRCTPFDDLAVGLPSRTAHDKHVSLSKEELNVYQKSHEILVLLLRLRQVCCHCGLIAAMLDPEDAAADVWTSVLRLVERELAAARVRSATLSGAVPVPARAALVADLNNPPPALGTGDTLLRAAGGARAQRHAQRRRARARARALVADLNNPASGVRVRTEYGVRTGTLCCELPAARVRSATLSGAVPVPARAALVADLNNPASGVRVRTEYGVRTGTLCCELPAARVRSATLSGAVPVPARAALVADLNNPASGVRVRTEYGVRTGTLCCELPAARVRSATLSGAVPVPARAALVADLNNPASGVRLPAARVRSATLSGAVPVPARAALVADLNNPASGVRLPAARVRSATLSGAVPVPARPPLVADLNNPASGVRVRTEYGQGHSVASCRRRACAAPRSAAPCPCPRAPPSSRTSTTPPPALGTYGVRTGTLCCELPAARVRSATLSGAVPVPARAALVADLNNPASGVRVRTEYGQGHSVASCRRRACAAPRSAAPCPCPRAPPSSRTSTTPPPALGYVRRTLCCELPAARVRSATLSGAVPVPARAALVADLNNPASGVRVRTEYGVRTGTLCCELPAARVRSATLSGAVPVPARAALVADLNNPASGVRVRTEYGQGHSVASCRRRACAAPRSAAPCPCPRAPPSSRTSTTPPPALGYVRSTDRDTLLRAAGGARAQRHAQRRRARAARAALVADLNNPASGVRVRTEYGQGHSVASCRRRACAAPRSAAPCPCPRAPPSSRTSTTPPPALGYVRRTLCCELPAARVRSATLSGAVPVPARAALVADLNNPPPALGYVRSTDRDTLLRAARRACAAPRSAAPCPCPRAPPSSRTSTTPPPALGYVRSTEGTLCCELPAARVRSATLSGAVPVPARAALVADLNNPASGVRLPAARVRSATLSGAVPVPARAALVADLNNPPPALGYVRRTLCCELPAARVAQRTLSGAVPVPARAALVADLNNPASGVKNQPESVSFLLFSHRSATTSASLLTIVLYSSKFSSGDLCPKWYTRGACWLKPSSIDAGLSTNRAPEELE
ncbi:LOW QUALITY PROTEIN: hypothetical protein MSG28_006723 [Choristoneura fumiferana]|uniref:Uncharacterized protein n=1 Tax=Choristoneura fumiferana TaxID=7141 RepID=A0ACC0JKZ1_CHOFU|nr:LOW QUALITY PROTEIN: hypothetical protein MSG28_006723 [Choristoneura fumiferana]